MGKVGWIYFLCAVSCAVLLILTYDNPIFDGQVAMVTGALFVSVISVVQLILKKTNKVESQSQQKIDFWGGVLVISILVVGLVYVLFIR